MNNKEKLLQKLSLFGVLSRDQVKNDLKTLASLARLKFLKKVYKKGRVFYELTEKALPALDCLRKKLLEEAKLKSHLNPRQRSFYKTLLEDVRFLDTSKEEASHFRFLGDWRLNQEPVLSQLQLAQFRFYQEKNLA